MRLFQVHSYTIFSVIHLQFTSAISSINAFSNSCKFKFEEFSVSELMDGPGERGGNSIADEDPDVQVVVD